MNVVKKIFVLLFIIVALVYVSNVVIIGEKLLGGLPWVFEFLFDVALIFAPIFVVGLSISTSLKKYKRAPNGALARCLNGKASRDEVKLLSEMMLSSGSFSESDKKEIRNSVRLATGWREKFKTILSERIETSKKQANTNGELAAISVVISGKGVFDSLILLFWKIKTINATIKLFGVRPSLKKLWVIYTNTIFGAFLAGSLDELSDIIDIDQSIVKLLPQFGGVAALAINAVPQAAFAYYSIVKASSMTRQYLFDAECKANLRDISKKAKEEAKESLLSINILDIIKEIKEKFNLIF